MKKVIILFTLIAVICVNWLKAQTLSNADYVSLNNLYTTTFNRFGFSHIDTPTGSYVNYMSFGHNSEVGYGGQIAIDYSINGLYYRSVRQGNPRTWSKVWDQENSNLPTVDWSAKNFIGSSLTINGGNSGIGEVRIKGTQVGAIEYSLFPAIRGINNTGFEIYDVTNSANRFTISGSGNVGIGTTTPQSKLAVNGTITTKEVNVTLDGWADFVFHPTYKLRTLSEVEQFIKANNHLPEIPTESEVKENGVSLGEMNAKLLQKVEELTLYMIEQQKQMSEQQKVNEMQNQHIKELEQKIDNLKNPK